MSKIDVVLWLKLKKENMVYMVTFRDKKTGVIKADVKVERQDGDARTLQALGLEALQKMKQLKRHLPSPLTTTWSYSECPSESVTLRNV